MVSSNNGQCCVCGTSTAQRCSACGTAGFDLFFCSREHQKLVYFAHKKVCGQNAKPFAFPPLTDAEAGQALANVDTPTPVENDTITVTIRQLFEHAGCRQEDTPEMIRYLTGVPTFVPPVITAELLCIVRSSLREFDVVKIPKTFDETLEKPEAFLSCIRPLTLVSRFFEALASYVHDQGGLLSHFSLYNDTHIRLLHHAIILSALSFRFFETGLKEFEAGEELTRFVHQASIYLHQDLVLINKEDAVLAKQWSRR
ncbi:hypothetical protein JCM6882_009710 [Rhodosporidiobolus microsporus]